VHLNVFLSSVRSDAFTHVNWGTLTAPILVDPTVDLIGQGVYPACDIVVENFTVNDERFNNAILSVRFEVLFFIAALSDLEKYVEKVIKAYATPPSFASTVEEITFDLGQENDLKLAMIKITMRSELGY